MKYLRWLADAIRPYWAAVTVMMTCHVLIAGCAIGFVYVSKKLVDVAVAVFGGSQEGSGLWPWAAAMIGIVLFRIALNALRSYLQTKTEIRLKNSLRHKLFDILLHLQTNGGSRHHSGDVLNRMQVGATADTMGAILVLIGLVIKTGLNMISLKLFVMIVFFSVAGPVCSHFLARTEAITNEDILDECEVVSHDNI